MTEPWPGPIAEYAIQMRVVFEAFVNAGFTEAQALTLVQLSWNSVLQHAIHKIGDGDE